MKTFCVYTRGREQPVEVRADWFALVGGEGEQSYRFKVKTPEGSEVIGEAPGAESSLHHRKGIARLTSRR